MPKIDQHTMLSDADLAAAIKAGNVTDDILAAYDNGKRANPVRYITTNHRAAYTIGLCDRARGGYFKLDSQPYGVEIFRVEEVGEYRGGITLAGTVVKGSETSRLFQHTSTRDTTGSWTVVYGVRDSELLHMAAVRVAC